MLRPIRGVTRFLMPSPGGVRNAERMDEGEEEGVEEGGAFPLPNSESGEYIGEGGNI